VPPQDEAALARAIVQVLGDPALQRTLGAAARQRVKDEFSVDTMVAKTLAVYEGRLQGVKA
jgi:glycosyltransferase involved in cell wall biosynthesis